MSLDKSDTDIPTMPILDVQQATDSNNQVFSCTNPRCTLKFTLYSAFLKHQNSTDKCVVKMRERSQMDEMRLLYISRTGIGEKYQKMTSAQTRQISFAKEWVPEIDPAVISVLVRQELPRGQALQNKKEGNIKLLDKV